MYPQLLFSGDSFPPHQRKSAVCINMREALNLGHMLFGKMLSDECRGLNSPPLAWLKFGQYGGVVWRYTAEAMPAPTS